MLHGISLNAGVRGGGVRRVIGSEARMVCAVGSPGENYRADSVASLEGLYCEGGGAEE